MKIVIAIDSFKGSLTSQEAGNAVREAAYTVWGEAAKPQVFPLADGGEGTMETLMGSMGGIRRQIRVTGPLGGAVTAGYGLIPEKRLAIMEMAQAAGLTLVPPEKRNPLNTTTFGLGEMILDALEEGCRNFIVGIGGSATNDCGIGMLEALGAGFTDENGVPVGIFGRDLERIRDIDLSGLDGRLHECVFTVACDVKNPLCGEQGCSAIFGPQKGAGPEGIARMDSALKRFAKLTGQDANVPGSGAAGGLGFAFRAFLKGKLMPGTDIVLRLLHLEDAAKGADLLITGEGRIDGQTAMGKGPAGIAALGIKYKIPVIAFAGELSEDACQCNEKGFTAIFPIVQGPCGIEQAMQKENARSNLCRTAVQVFRLCRACMTKQGYY